jgi:hypothetical protein
MPNYQNGKVYTIRSRSRPDLVYVGSTTQTLSNRFGKHKADKTTTSKIITDIKDSYIELYEAYPCNNREELNRKEGEVMRSMNCVNIRLAGRTPKEHYRDNRPEILIKKKIYDETHREEHKQYRETHREEQKQYFENEKNKQTCICGSIYNYGHVSHRKGHYKTQKHQLHLDNVYKIIRGE